MLTWLSSIRARLALLVGVSVLVAAVVGTVGTDAGVPLWLGLPTTIALALAVTHWLATGLTAPLREMTDATARMAQGDHAVRVRADSQDEVGRLGRAFNGMAADLAAAEEHRRRLVATVAHELRTPLTAQQALLENLVDGVVAPDDAALGAALAQSERLGALVGDLLDLSRSDGRGVPLQPTDVRVRDLLEQAVGEAELQGREVSLVVDVAPDELTVRADRGRLAQVVANLTDNALRHSPKGGTVTLTARREPAGRWSLVVADEGPGLDPARADALVHRFGAGADDRSGGTGLGLAIAGWVATMHGGSLQALSTPPGEKGARLRLELPTDPATPPSPEPSPVTGTTTPISQETTMTPAPLPSPAVPPPSPAPVATPAPTPPSTTPRAHLPWWPEQTRTPQPRLLAAALGVGLAASVLLPGHAIGLGMLVVLALGGAALWLTSPRRGSRWSWFTVALTLPLGLTTVLRADPVITFFAVATAGLLAAVACTDARTVTGMLASVAAWPLSALRGLPLLDRTVRALASHGRLWPAVRTTAVSLVLLLVFGGLLASADAVLGSWASRLLPSLTISDMTVFRGFTLVFFAGVTLCGLYLALNPPPVDRIRPSAWVSARVPVREWQVPLLVVIAVFVAWLVAQGAALVGGHDYVLRTTGVTYAESARQGFGQLTLVTALTVLLVTGVRSWGRVGSARDALVMKGLGATLCVLALLVVGSALRRMALYQSAYGWTTARVTAILIELWLGIVLLTLLASLLVGWRSWLGRTVLVAGVALVLVWSLGGTAGWVAQQNVERFHETGRLDTDYLVSLGDDAVPAIHGSDLSPDLKACIIASTGRDAVPGSTAVEERRGLPAWNLARSRAERIRSGYVMPTGCVPTSRYVS